MSLVLIAYIFSIYPNILAASTIAIVACIAFSVFVVGGRVIYVFDVYTDQEKRNDVLRWAKSIFKRTFIVFLCLTCFRIILPSENGIKWILGAYVAEYAYEQITQAVGATNLPQSAVIYLNDLLNTIQPEKIENVENE